jgi:hypothetical protein
MIERKYLKTEKEEVKNLSSGVMASPDPDPDGSNKEKH